MRETLYEEQLVVILRISRQLPTLSWDLPFMCPAADQCISYIPASHVLLNYSET